MEQLTKKRTSRQSNAPRLRKGKIAHVTVSDRDRALIRPVLERYDYLPANYIYAFTGGSLRWLRRRLVDLAVEPCGWLHKPEAQYQHANANYRYGVFGLATTPVSRPFFHNLKADMAMAQIELGAREGFDLISFDRILAKAPKPKDTFPTRDALNPRTVKLLHQLPDTHSKKLYAVTPDTDPFGIGNGNVARFFYGIEADRATERKDTHNSKIASIRRKISLCLAMDAQKVSQRVYGLPTPFYYPFEFEEEAEFKTVLKIIYELTDGQGTPYILLNAFPSYNSSQTPPPPDGAHFRSTWRRAWDTDFRMDQL